MTFVFSTNPADYDEPATFEDIGGPELMAHIVTLLQVLTAGLSDEVTNRGTADTAHAAITDGTAHGINTLIANAIANLVNTAPATLDTLAELAAALGDDPNLAATLTALIGTKQDHAAVLDATTASFTTAKDAALTAVQATVAAREAASPAVTNSPRAYFSKIAGATDHDKLTQFLATFVAQEFKPTLFWDEMRAYTLTGVYDLYEGFTTEGLAQTPVDQDRASGTVEYPNPQVIRLRPTVNNSGMFRIPTKAGATSNSPLQHFGVRVGNLVFDGGGYSDARDRLFVPNPAMVLWTMTMRNFGYQDGAGIIGSVTDPQAVDAVAWGGEFVNINTIQNAGGEGIGWNMKGSDCRIKPTLLLLDARADLGGTHLSTTACLAKLGGFSKSSVTGLYTTAERAVGLVLAGSPGQSTQVMSRLRDFEAEGRDAGAFGSGGRGAYGAVIQVENGDWTLTDGWIAYGMLNPSAARGGETKNRGLVHIGQTSPNGSHAIMNALTFAFPTGVDPATTPCVYVEPNCTLYIAQCMGHGATRNTRFTPRVKASTSATVIADTSVVVETY